MPGELLPVMAAPIVSKSQLIHGKPDLYLIVSTTAPKLVEYVANAGTV